MNAIRMVWVISRHYNTDERMVPLMELIAGEIAGKVHHLSLHILELLHLLRPLLLLHLRHLLDTPMSVFIAFVERNMPTAM